MTFSPGDLLHLHLDPSPHQIAQRQRRRRPTTVQDRLELPRTARRPNSPSVRTRSPSRPAPISPPPAPAPASGPGVPPAARGSAGSAPPSSTWSTRFAILRSTSTISRRTSFSPGRLPGIQTPALSLKLGQDPRRATDGESGQDSRRDRREDHPLGPRPRHARSATARARLVARAHQVLPRWAPPTCATAPQAEQRSSPSSRCRGYAVRRRGRAAIQLPVAVPRTAELLTNLQQPRLRRIPQRIAQDLQPRNVPQPLVALLRVARLLDDRTVQWVAPVRLLAPRPTPDVFRVGQHPAHLVGMPRGRRRTVVLRCLEPGQLAGDLPHRPLLDGEPGEDQDHPARVHLVDHVLHPRPAVPTPPTRLGPPLPVPSRTRSNSRPTQYPDRTTPSWPLSTYWRRSRRYCSCCNP